MGNQVCCAGATNQATDFDHFHQAHSHNRRMQHGGVVGQNGKRAPNHSGYYGGSGRKSKPGRPISTHDMMLSKGKDDSLFYSQAGTSHDDNSKNTRLNNM